MEPTEEELLGQLSELRRTLRNLAADADRQRAFIEQLGTAPSIDEIALEFDDRYIVTPRFFKHGLLNSKQQSALDLVDAQLKKMSGRENAELWTLDALQRPEWARVRELARAALEAIELEQ